MRRLAVLAGTALFVAVAATALDGLRRSWATRVAVSGHSMEPTVAHGDWLLVDPLAYSGRDPRVGELVVVIDPRRPDRVLIKRVASVTPDGVLALAGDHPAHDVELALGDVDPDAVIGRPWLRYWPLDRFGRVY